MCMVALGDTLQKVWMFFLWTRETCSFSSASSSASESLEKEKKKYRTLETWNNFLEAGKQCEWMTPAWGEAAQCRLWKGVQWLRLPSSAPPSDGCSWVPSYSRGCFITDHLAAAPGSTAYPLQPEGDGISCSFHQDLPAWHFRLQLVKEDLQEHFVPWIWRIVSLQGGSGSLWGRKWWHCYCWKMIMHRLNCNLCLKIHC